MHDKASKWGSNLQRSPLSLERRPHRLTHRRQRRILLKTGARGPLLTTAHPPLLSSAPMRGLPFPQDAAFNREQSHEFGTPGPASTSGLGDNISFDPALAVHPAAPHFIPNGAGSSGSPIVCPFTRFSTFLVKEVAKIETSASAKLRRDASRFLSSRQHLTYVHCRTSAPSRPAWPSSVTRRARRVIRLPHSLRLTATQIQTPSQIPTSH